MEIEKKNDEPEEWSIRKAHAEMKFGVLPFNSSGMSHHEMCIKHIPLSWREFFLSARPEIDHAFRLVKKNSDITNNAIYPLPRNIVNAFWACPFPLVKVVIIGQDPYPGQMSNGFPKATGMSFSCDRDSREVPGSLQTIYRELKRTIPGWTDPGHGDLSSWARQGVLLYNTALTVESGSPGAHNGYWKPFTEKLMDYFNENAKGVVFMLWGRPAQKSAESIYTSKHYKLEAYHPSPMNNGKVGREFATCNHFNLCNELLEKTNRSPIDWTVR